LDRDGRPLIIMPSDAFHHLSDADALALIAVIRAQPAIDHVVPARDLGPLATLLIGAGLFPTAEQPPQAGPVTAPTRGVPPEYGQYLVQTIGCSSCHGANYAGRKPGQGPPAGPNLTRIVPQWTESQFVSFFHNGLDPFGHKASDEMPWEIIGRAYDDNELRAMYAYLRTLPVTVGP